MTRQNERPTDRRVGNVRVQVVFVTQARGEFLPLRWPTHGAAHAEVFVWDRMQL
jgi:hypothetical protein